jgi:hypothetical protein
LLSNFNLHRYAKGAAEGKYRRRHEVAASAASPATAHAMPRRIESRLPFSCQRYDKVTFQCDACRAAQGAEDARHRAIHEAHAAQYEKGKRERAKRQREDK